MKNKIEAIFGAEPRREGEIPQTAWVGHGGVDRIETREQNLGTYGILWFDVYSGDQLLESYNAIHIANVVYAKDNANG